MLLSEAYNQFCLQEIILAHRSDKTRRNYMSALSSFLRSMKGYDPPVGLISVPLILQWRIDMERRGVQPGSIKSNLSTLRKVFKYLRTEGFEVIPHSDIELPSVKRKNHTWITSDEVKKILNVIESPRDKAIFAALYGTGARISELLNLDRDSIIDGCAEIIGKGSKPGTLYFDPLSLKLIDEYLNTRRDKLKPLFISGQYRRITVSRIEQLSHIYTDAAGIDKIVTPHVYRHSFASDLKLNGADIYDIQQQLRHSNIATTAQIYTHISEPQRKEVHRRFHSQIEL